MRFLPRFASRLLERQRGKQRRRGQSLTEYGLAIGLIAVVAIAGLMGLSRRLANPDEKYAKDTKNVMVGTAPAGSEPGVYDKVNNRLAKTNSDQGGNCPVDELWMVPD